MKSDIILDTISFLKDNVTSVCFIPYKVFHSIDKGKRNVIL